MKEALADLRESEIATMPRGIAGCFYGVDLEKLAPHAARVGLGMSTFRGSVSGLMDARGS